MERLDCRRGPPARHAGAEWQRLSDMSYARSNLAAAVLDERIIVIGGYDGLQPVPYVEAYSDELGRWCELSPIITPRSALAVCVLAMPLAS